MKSIPLRLMIATTLIIGTVYALSVIVTQETVTLAMILTAFVVLKFIVRTMLYIFFKVIKWAIILAVTGTLLVSLF